MVLKISYTVVLSLLLSCTREFNNDNTEKREIQKDNPNTIDAKIKALPHNQIQVIKYDSCEYIIYKDKEDENSSYGLMAHKGNCSNPIHQSSN
jgi:hypothetical protein